MRAVLPYISHFFLPEFMICFVDILYCTVAANVYLPFLSPCSPQFCLFQDKAGAVWCGPDLKRKDTFPPPSPPSLSSFSSPPLPQQGGPTNSSRTGEPLSPPQEVEMKGQGLRLQFSAEKWIKNPGVCQYYNEL